MSFEKGFCDVQERVASCLLIFQTEAMDTNYGMRSLAFPYVKVIDAELHNSLPQTV